MTVAPGESGSFEIYNGDELIYSKLDTGDFPDEDAIVDQLR